MNIAHSFSEISTIREAKSHRKRKRRKWKNLSSKFTGSLYSGHDFGDECNYNCYGMLPIWYWSNYFKAVEWQRNHNVAFWKSYALGLQHENRYVVMEFQKQLPGRACSASLTFPNMDSANRMTWGAFNMTDEVEDGGEMEISSLENGEIQFEMSQEMMKFFEQSIKHKLEMKRQKEEREKCDWMNVEGREMLDSHDEREKEMKLLYGGGSSMIIGMETAVQLSFDKYCYLKCPKYWPNIPINI